MAEEGSGIVIAFALRGFGYLLFCGLASVEGAVDMQLVGRVWLNSVVRSCLL